MLRAARQDFYSGGRLYVGGYEAKEGVGRNVYPNIGVVVECRPDRFEEASFLRQFSTCVGTQGRLDSVCYATKYLRKSLPEEPTGRCHRCTYTCPYVRRRGGSPGAAQI